MVMEMNEFIKHFAEQLDEIPEAGLTKDVEFKQLDSWSSLTALSVIAMVDEEYGVIIGGHDIREAKTIEDLFRIVESKK